MQPSAERPPLVQRSGYYRTPRRSIRTRVLVLFVIVLLCAGLGTWWRFTKREQYDLILWNAEIFDGTGAAPFVGTVAVRGDRIARVIRGRTHWLFPLDSPTVIDARGLALSPGFIDTHSHADFSIGEGSSPIHAENFVQQGVTTMIVGNCGRSSKDIGTFARLLTRRKVDMNVASLVGLNTVRSLVMKDVPRPPTATEVTLMCVLVDEAMRSGAVGASTGYAYVPGRFATKAEIEAQLRIVARYGGIHTSHVRDEGAGILPSIEEATSVSRAAHVPVLISHLKISGKRNCQQYSSLLSQVQAYQQAPGSRGIFFDQYPYSASSSSLELYLPTWFLAQSHVERIHTIRTTPTRLRGDMVQLLAVDGFRDFNFAQIASFVPHREWQGETLAGVDRTRMGGRTSTVETQLDLMLQMLEQGGAQMIYHNICEDVMLRLPKDLVLMVGSDSAIRYDDGTVIPHPRGWGTFPRYLRAFAATGRLTWQEAIHRITDLPAQVFGLPLRGRVRVGYYADLVLFDRGRFRDGATFREPYRRPEGLRYVFINGVAVIESRSSLYSVEAVSTGRCPGRFLRRSLSAIKRDSSGVIPPMQ